MMINSQKDLYQGFSLVEVLIALLILAVSMIGLTRFQSDMINSNSIAKQRTEATILAQNKIEFFRSQISQNNSTSAVSHGSEEINIENTTYTREWNSIKLNKLNSDSPGDIELKLTIRWPDLKHVSLDNKTLASERTTIYLSTIISQQPFSDSALKLKQIKSKPLKLVGAPSIKHD